VPAPLVPPRNADGGRTVRAENKIGVRTTPHRRGELVDIDQWWSAGERVVLRLGDSDREIFVRRMGSGPPMTMLHAFLSSSHDWARTAPRLAERYELLLPDFLGLGASEKPVGHSYSLHEQADLVEALWALESITSTVVVAHDYAVSVTQELLARRAEGALAVDLVAVHMLNGGVYPHLYRPEAASMALLDPEHGPQLAATLTEELFALAVRPTFAGGFDHREDSADIFRAATRDGGREVATRLAGYITERAANSERWVSALEQTDVPLSFVWGMLDPVAGADMADQIRERRPDAPFVALDDVAHWPALEAPEQVVAALLGS
jgi:pimeloyl-ACP methyl ester carboxylesterase